MASIVFVANRERQVVMMCAAADLFKKSVASTDDLAVLFIENNDRISLQEQQALARADFVLISWMGYSDEVVFLKAGCDILHKRKTRFAILSSDLSPDEAVQQVSLSEYTCMHEYLSFSGIQNCCNLWHWLVHSFGESKIAPAPEPILLEWNGIYHPAAHGIFTNPETYYNQFCSPKQLTVGILFSRDEWVWQDLAYQQALITEIEQQGLNALPVFSQWSKNSKDNIPGLDQAVAKYFYKDGRPIVDVVINTFKFSLTNGKAQDQQFLYDLDCSMLQAYGLLSTEQEWRENSIGMTPIEICFSVAMPEFDGVIHSVPLSVKDSDEQGIKHYLPLADRMPILVSKAKKWANLKRKANSDKKIAIIFHNYPPTNASIGSAQGLDSPESVRLLLQTMQRAGYRIDKVPDDSKSFMDDLLQCATNDRRFLNESQARAHPTKLLKEQYQSYFDDLPLQNKQQLAKDWQKPPGEVFVYDDNLLIPGMMNGNIFITVQPPRGFGEDPSKILHDPNCAPTHHYLAYYHWLRDIWQADAVLHIGTHGSLEWLPGKGAGLSETCYPELALGDLPNIYPYLLTIVGEGIQAKRRGAACLIGHLPPPVTMAGTYEGLAELEKLLDEYAHFSTYNLADTLKIEQLIREKAKELHLADDIVGTTDIEFDVYRQNLHTYLSEIKHMQIRAGLHIFGSPPAGENLLAYLQALVQVANGEIPALPQVIASSMGYDYYQLFSECGQIVSGTDKTKGEVLDEICTISEGIIACLEKYSFSAESLVQVSKLPYIDHINAAATDQIILVCKYICQQLVPNLQKTSQEITNTLRAIEGAFIEPGPAGAPTSGCADILPTGRNFYGIDPNTLPSKVAWDSGKNLGDALISRFISEEGNYPETVGMVFWSGSNMRSHGQCVAEFLYLIGVRPVWQPGSLRVIGLEVIPLAELKRPRIDVTARISGLFRDTLPQSSLWMDQAVRIVADLAEDPEQNFIRKHVLADKAALQASGLPEDDLDQAYYRIFGCPPGSYGAGVGAILEAKNWENVDDLAAVYVRWGAHVYGKEQTGTFVPENFKRRLQSIQVTVKNEDNHEVHMLNSDDFNAYHGGMIAAVRSLSGKAPRSYCGDSTDRGHVVLRSLEEETKRLFRGEVMNPKYIQGMQKHGYKGAADLAGTVSHCYDWDATSQVMEDWMYDGLAQKYALDKQMQDWMKDVNPWALQRIAEKLLEAAQRGMWQAAPTTLEQLRSLYLSIEGDLEERSDEL